MMMLMSLSMMPVEIFLPVLMIVFASILYPSLTLISYFGGDTDEVRIESIESAEKVRVAAYPSQYLW